MRLTWDNAQQAYNPFPAFLCLSGCFLYILISAPLMDEWGVHYASDGGQAYEKFHPGTILIILAFILMLWNEGNPIQKMLTLWSEQRFLMAFLCFYGVLLFYMSLRSGMQGLGFIIDVQVTAVLCAIILATAPASYCRHAIAIFIALALINSVIGLAEMIGAFRIFKFDPDWPVLSEPYFRASALLGHPLNNAMFTTLALFILLATHFRASSKWFCALILLASLGAFGGRAALIFSLFGLLLIGGVRFATVFFLKDYSLQKLLWGAAALIVTPFCLAGILYALMHGLAGEHLAHRLYWDESAGSRTLAIKAFDYMKTEEILLGVSTEKMMDIAYRMSQDMPVFTIENPWLLMLMYLGMVAFPLWFIGTMRFAHLLARGNPLALQLAVLAYFVIASSYNSFGCKSTLYPIMVCAVVCASRAYKKLA